MIKILRKLYLYIKGKEIWDAKMSEHLEMEIVSRTKKLTPIEEYVVEMVIDAIIRSCINHKDTLEETIGFVKEQYSHAEEEYITSRFEVLSAEPSK